MIITGLSPEDLLCIDYLSTVLVNMGDLLTVYGATSEAQYRVNRQLWFMSRSDIAGLIHSTSSLIRPPFLARYCNHVERWPLAGGRSIYIDSSYIIDLWPY